MGPPIPTTPPDLRARLAESRARLVELAPAVKEAVAARREALAIHQQSAPDGDVNYDRWFNGTFKSFGIESGAGALRDEIKALADVLADVDEPAPHRSLTIDYTV
jgi:hypothetical protein